MLHGTTYRKADYVLLYSQVRQFVRHLSFFFLNDDDIKELLFQRQVFLKLDRVSRTGEEIGQRDSEQPVPVNKSVHNFLIFLLS